MQVIARERERKRDESKSKRQEQEQGRVGCINVLLDVVDVVN